MQLTALLAAALAAATGVLAQSGNSGTIKVTYTYDYGNPQFSTYGVSCSDGKNGIRTKYGYKTIGQVPTYPYVGGIPAANYNSTSCGSCWRLDYGGQTIIFTAIDHAGATFNIARPAMDKLTNNKTDALGGSITGAKYAKVANSVCSLPA